MSFDTEPKIEQTSSGGTPAVSTDMTLEKAVEMGEYDPEFLATFASWHSLSPHVQLQFIRQGLDNRKKHLITQYAELNNVLHYSVKPELQDALRSIEKQMDKLERDREKLYLLYSKKM